MAEPCIILSLVAEPTECFDGYYNLDVTVTFSNPPGMINGDGTTGTLVISTNCGGGGSSPYVIPSPFPDLVVITETATIKLYDLQGRQILSKETNQVNTSFGIENLQDGIYLVNIENEEGSITKKIILRRN